MEMAEVFAYMKKNTPSSADIKKIIKFLTKPIEPQKKMCWCWCGHFQTHQHINCNHCGQDFKKISEITQFGIIMKHVNYYKIYKCKDPLENSLRWSYALNNRSLGKPSYDAFKIAFNHITVILNSIRSF